MLLVATSICQASGTSPALPYCSYPHESCLDIQQTIVQLYISPLSAPRSVDIRVIFRQLSVLSVGWPVADIQSPDTGPGQTHFRHPSASSTGPCWWHPHGQADKDVKLGHNHRTLYFIFPRAGVTRESVIQEVTQAVKFFLLPSVATVLFTIVTRSLVVRSNSDKDNSSKIITVFCHSSGFSSKRIRYI